MTKKTVTTAINMGTSGMRVMEVAAREPNQARKPTCASPSAIATNVANQTRTLQACLLARMSFQVTTLASSITEITARATVTGLIQRLPPIQPTSAATASKPIVTSGRDIHVRGLTCKSHCQQVGRERGQKHGTGDAGGGKAGPHQVSADFSRTIVW